MDGSSSGDSDKSPKKQPPKKVAKVDKAADKASPEANKPRAPSKGTYPKPKNFAERMMNVLENAVSPDIISWHGEEDLVSIDTRALKQSDLLNERFQGIKYAAFVRNLSRW